MDSVDTRRGKRRSSMHIFWGGTQEPTLDVSITNVNGKDSLGSSRKFSTVDRRTADSKKANKTEERSSFRKFARYLLSNEPTEKYEAVNVRKCTNSLCLVPEQHSMEDTGDPLRLTVDQESVDSSIAHDLGGLTIVKRHTTVASREQPCNMPLQKNKMILNANHNHADTAVLSSYLSRVVVITDITIQTSISNVLKQVYGGPIERIEIHKRATNQEIVKPLLVYKSSTATSSPTNWDALEIVLFFMRHEDAVAFYEYSKTGMFLVNGVHLSTYWGHFMKKSDDEEEVLERMEKRSDKARRVLVFKKPVVEKRHRTAYEKRHWPDPYTHFTRNFDYEQVRLDFERYGGLVEVLPVISRKTCFGVEFTDVRTAMLVKQIIQQESEDIVGFDDSVRLDSELRERYKDWYIWFGSDPCDKPVL